MLPRVHCITDLPFRDSPFGRENTLDLIEAVVCQGVDAVQVRAKQLADRDLYSFTRSVVDRLRGKAVTVIVNDRLDIALATGAHGIHLGLDDLPVAEARRLAPAGFLIGATCRSASHAAEARAQGADYVGVGPVYASTTKAGLPSAVGLATLRETAKVLPSIAISGINADRIPDVMAAGAYGVAVVAAISGAKHPELAAKEIVDAVLAA